MIYKPKLRKIEGDPFIVIEDDLSEVFDAYAKLLLRRYQEDARFNFTRD
jgi:hypothetical protein